jgi:hypothetical protein
LAVEVLLYARLKRGVADVRGRPDRDALLSAVDRALELPRQMVGRRHACRGRCARAEKPHDLTRADLIQTKELSDIHAREIRTSYKQRVLVLTAGSRGLPDVLGLRRGSGARGSPSPEAPGGTSCAAFPARRTEVWCGRRVEPSRGLGPYGLSCHFGFRRRRHARMHLASLASPFGPSREAIENPRFIRPTPGMWTSIPLIPCSPRSG